MRENKYGLKRKLSSFLLFAVIQLAVMGKSKRKHAVDEHTKAFLVDAFHGGSHAQLVVVVTLDNSGVHPMRSRHTTYVMCVSNIR